MFVCFFSWSPKKIIKRSLANHNPVGEDEELHVGSEGTEHQATSDHHPAEDGHGTGTEVLHADAADGTWKKESEAQKSVSGSIQ